MAGGNGAHALNAAADAMIAASHPAALLRPTARIDESVDMVPSVTDLPGKIALAQVADGTRASPGLLTRNWLRRAVCYVPRTGGRSCEHGASAGRAHG
ncbi:hypothetical protein BN2475_720062 [Paraburkholderia ribeironis]|uniref:Uncharacterized protein n=1 Tax=Paraburkholderia ribeironis TaxID=1247936 RepID=A0A1N7SJ62_9BURK|nr:hypothetical protein BN2475_720062 [Paraburkholderia ribeironis]